MSGTITINTELVVLTSIGMLTTMMEGASRTVAEHMDDIWKLTLPEDWFGPAFEQVAKSIMALVVLSRCLTFHLYIVAYVMLLYALITETVISLMILWIFLAAMRSIFLNLISALLGCLLCSFCCTLKASCFEFAVIKGVELACSVYLWLTIGGFYLKLRDNEGQPFQDVSVNPLSHGEPQPRDAEHENRCCDFFVWLSQYGINRYGRDRANLILRILDMSKHEVREFQERLRNMMGGGNVEAEQSRRSVRSGREVAPSEPSRRSVRSAREVAPTEPSSGTAAGSSRNTDTSKDACACPEGCATACPDICTEDVCMLKPQSQKKMKKSISKDSNVIPKAAPKEIQKDEVSDEDWKKKVPIEQSRVDSEVVQPAKKEFFKEGYDFSKNVNKKGIVKEECADVALAARSTQYSRNFDHTAQGTQYSDDFCDKYIEKYRSELKKKPSSLKTPKNCVRPFDRNEIIPNPCLDLRPSINNATSTSRTYDPCQVQNQSHGRKAVANSRGRTMETVRHHTEDGSIISIKVLVVPVESEKECVKVPQRKENVNDVHLCHCIVPAHSTSIPCSEAKSGLLNSTDLITPIHSDVPTVKSEPSKDSDAFQAFPVQTEDLKYEPKENEDVVKEPKPILKRRSFTQGTPVVTHSSKSGMSFLALAETEEKQANENPANSRQVEPKTVYKDKPKTTPGYPFLLTQENEDTETTATPISKEVSFSKSTQSVLKPTSQEETGEGEKVDFETQKNNSTPRKTVSDPGLPTPIDDKAVQYDKLMKPEENVEFKKPSIESIEKWEKVNEDLKRRISENKEEEERLAKESPPKDPKVEDARRRVSENKDDGKRLVKESPSFIRDPTFPDFKRRASENKEDDERLIKESPSFIRDPKTINRRKKSSVHSRELQAIPENSEMKKVESAAASQEERGSDSSLNLLFSSQSDGFKLGPSPTRIKNISDQQKRIAQRRVSLTDEEWLRVYEDFLQGSFSRPENQGDDASDFYAQDLYPSTDSYEKSLIEERQNKDTKNYTASYALTKYNKSESSYSDLQLVNDLLLEREDDRTFEYWAPLYLDLLSNRNEFSDDTSSFSTVMSSTSTVSKIDKNMWTTKCHEFMEKAKHLENEICKRFSIESLRTTSDLTISSGIDDQIECNDDLERKLKEIIEKTDDNSQEDSTSN